MSVTFEATLSAISAHALTCGHDNGVTEHRWGSYADAAEFLRNELDEHGGTGHLAVCGDEDCQYQRMFTHAIEVDPSPEVNLTTTNSLHLLGLLGIEAEDGEHPVGSMPAQDFLGRVLIAQAVNPVDAGQPVTESTAESGMKIIDCGRNEGYSDHRLAELREIAEFGLDRGRDIQWG